MKKENETIKELIDITMIEEEKESFEDLLKTVPGLVIEKLWISADVRAERGEERWLNIVLRKQG